MKNFSFKLNDECHSMIHSGFEVKDLINFKKNILLDVFKNTHRKNITKFQAVKIIFGFKRSFMEKKSNSS
jgi:hypothetical protein